MPRSIGSLLESDNVLLNPVAIFGYISNLRERDYYLDLNLPSEWTVGTSLKSTNGLYFASGFDQLADGPLLMGNLTHTTSLVDNTEINVFTYSKKGKFDSELLSSSFQQVWKDASKFLGGLPVDQYNSLYHFDDNFPGGSNEHSSSAVFTLAENDFLTGQISWLKTSAAHEFFHIITPLHLRSEIVDNFNFAVPTPSEHIWWYEGVTVWASIMMQYRNQSIKLLDFFNQILWHGSVTTQASLSSAGLNCYKDNVSWFLAYNRGAMVATLLDIRLLELSKGTRGLREVVLELYSTYKDLPFPDDSFYDILTQMTYPEIGEFLNLYVKGSDPLPITDYRLLQQ